MEEEVTREDDVESMIDRRASVLSNDSSNSLPPATSPDAETCLLARTNLGVGSISIHLGKLEGQLVSLSVKRKRSRYPSSAASTVSSVVLPPCCVGISSTTDCPPTSSPPHLRSLASQRELPVLQAAD